MGPAYKVFAVSKGDRKAVKGEYNFRTRQTTLGGKFDLEVYTWWPRTDKETGEIMPGKFDIRPTPGHPYFANPDGYWLNGTVWPPVKRAATPTQPDDAEAVPTAPPPALDFGPQP